ncbi:MAG: malate dehydrogenase [Planctomycetaceae bacterium]|nr:malate dehydrogenase [Planctomycetaceae bacterium]
MNALSRFSAQSLQEFCIQVFTHFDVASEDAETAAKVLISSDLRGIDSHGIARLFGYAGMLKEGRIKARPDVRVVHESPSTATVDGDNGLGLIVGPQANELAMQKAAAVGSGWVSVRNSNHYGIAGYYVLRALERDMIGWSMTNATSWVTPLWAAERRLGTNPIAIAFPGLREPPIVIDLATSVIAYGKIEIARRNGESIPPDWAVDESGKPTTNPDDVPAAGALAPLGTDRERGGHKGYCLSSMVDLLTGVLSGANWGPFVPPFWPRDEGQATRVGEGVGHFFGAMRIDGFGPPEEFKQRVDDWITTLRASKPAEGTDGPLIPGDPEREAEQDRGPNGIPLTLPVVESLEKLARETGIPFGN